MVMLHVGYARIACVIGSAAMSFFAHVERTRHPLSRLDTRIYLADCVAPLDSETCIAAIIAKNPGSAAPAKTGERTDLELDGDKRISTARNRFLDTFHDANIKVPVRAIARVWSLC